jgi:hypothetical protein
MQTDMSSCKPTSLCHSPLSCSRMSSETASCMRATLPASQWQQRAMPLQRIGAGLAQECHTILQRVLVSSQRHHPPASRAAAAPRPYDYRASCARRGNSFARAHARRSARSGNAAHLKQSRVKVFRAARAAPLLRVCRQVRRGQEVAPGAWLLKGERSVRRSSPRLHGGTTARWVSLHEHTASSTPCIYIIPTGHTYCCCANVHTA